MNEKAYEQAQTQMETNIINWETLNRFKPRHTEKLSIKIDLIDLMGKFNLNEDWQTNFVDKRDNHLIYG